MTLENPDDFSLSIKGRWDEIRSDWLKTKTSATATRFTNETKFFFEDAGDTLWITFVEDRLYWAFLEPGKPQPYGDGSSTFRRVAGGWSCHDILGQELVKSNLSGAITKLAAYRGTSCRVDVEKRLVARINAQKSKDIERALAQYQQLSGALIPLIKSLHPSEFEDLTDLIFSASGWRRLSRVGGTQATTDFDLELPTTGERAFVQVKSSTSQAQFDDYVDRMQQTSASKMFYVYHTGKVQNGDRDDVIVMDGPRVAKMAVDAGLTDWVIEKASDHEAVGP